MHKGTKNPHTPEWNKKISEGVKRQHAEGRVRIVGFTAEQREKAYKVLRGRRLTPEHKRKLRMAKLGRTLTPEHRFKIGLSHKGKMPANMARGDLWGENHNCWKGGITPETIKIRNSAETAVWRKAVFERDQYTCQKCHERGGYLHAHHVQSFSKYPKERFNIENGLTLCKSCHYNEHRNDN